jgi:CxxC motif-containing protein (DUF1111 family)
MSRQQWPRPAARDWRADVANGDARGQRRERFATSDARHRVATAIHQRPVEGSAVIVSYTTNYGQYADGTPYSLRKPNYAFQGTTPEFFSARLAPPLVGLGLLEAVSESTIAALADPDDANQDGISGRMQIVIDPETGQQRLGRLTSKGGKARLSHQIAAALNATWA